MSCVKEFRYSIKQSVTFMFFMFHLILSFKIFGTERIMTSVNIINVAVVFVVLNLTFSVVHNAVITKNEDTQNSQSDICLTPDCIKQAAFILNNMDQQVDPCDDFYKYTCGNFIKKTFVPQDKFSVSSYSSVQDSLTNDLLDGLQMEIQPNDLDTFKKMKIHYQNCLNESLIEEEGLEPYLDKLKKAGGWPILMEDDWSEDTYAWEDTMIKLQFLGFSTGFPFYLSIYKDSKNETNNIFYLYPAVTIIYNETKLYLESNKTLNAYIDYILDIAVMLGADKPIASQEVKDLLDFEINLLKLEKPFEDTSEEDEKNSSAKQRKTILELSEQFPSIQWIELFNRTLSLVNETIYESDIVEIFDIHYLDKLETLLKETPKRTLANYQIWQVINGMIRFMPKKFMSRKAIYQSIINDISITKINREMVCLYAVEGALYVAINGLYVRKYFDREVKEKVTQMAVDIKNQFNENFQNGWQSHANTTEEIVNKLNSMNISIAYPDELLDDKILEEFYANLNIESGLYIESALNASLFKNRELYKRLRQSADKNRWTKHALVAFVNAYYSSENMIGIPAGILHEPFIYIRGPEYLNYGAIGSIIGHEITHGIYTDRQERVLNGTAATNNDTEIFNQCFIDKYNNYNTSEGIAVNGSRTLHENIPDVTGFKIAYQVYNKWIERNNITESNLPGLDHNPLQMFWISAASTFCHKNKNQYLKKKMQWDNHSPDEARINVAFSNIDDFAKDFKCKVGLGMNPEKKCDLW